MSSTNRPTGRVFVPSRTGKVKRRRLNRYVFRMLPCHDCGQPITWCWDVESQRWQAVALTDGGDRWIFDMNPIFDGTAHRVHWPHNMQSAKRIEASRKGAAVANILGQIRPGEDRGEEEGEGRDPDFSDF